MLDEAQLPLTKDSIADVETLLDALSREGHNDLAEHLRELDGFATLDARGSGNRELSLREAISTVHQRGYRIDRVNQTDYALAHGAVQSFVAYVDVHFVVLWLGRSSLHHDEQEKAKSVARERLVNLLTIRPV